ncbi:hypothetical protein Ancab_030119 [Ancistrocladus abbreviatus]
MASLGTTRMTLLAIALLSIHLLLGCTSGDGDRDGDGSQSGTGEGAEEAKDPTKIVAKALYCFSDKYIYSNCEEAYRLTQSGDLLVPPEHTDQFCTGPCLAETDLVLDCIDEIMSNFHFYNKATTEDVRDTVKAGCGYGPERGDFDVSKHMEAEEGNRGSRSAIPPLLGSIVMITVHMLLLRWRGASSQLPCFDMD